MRDAPVEIVPYDPLWPARFEAERECLVGVLAPWLDGGIHHVGSTAVPGLAAKPTHHLHLVEPHHPEWAARLAFREILRTDRGVAADYQRLKEHLAARFRDDREAYTDAKADFIRSTLASS